MNQQETILSRLAFIAAYVIVIPFIIGLIRFRRIGRSEKIILLLLTFSIISESIGIYFRSRHINNLIFYHIYTIVEFCTISIYFYLVISYKILRNVVLALLIPFMVIASFDIPSVELNTSDSLTTSYEGIAVILFCIGYFYSLFRDPVYDKILNAPPFWFASSFLIYFSGTLFVFVFSSYITQNSLASGKLLWGINSGIAILFNLLFTIGFWKTKKT